MASGIDLLVWSEEEGGLCHSDYEAVAALEVKLLMYVCTLSKLNFPPKGAAAVWIMMSWGGYCAIALVVLL